MDNPIQKTPRLTEFDYSQPGAYFVTICTNERKKLLSQIYTVGAGVLDRPTVELLPCGMVADKYIRQMNDFYEYVSVDAFVIMPNHIHFLIRILDDGRSRTPAPTKSNATIAQFVSTFKRFCNKEYGKNIWQRSYHDHVIRGEEDYREVWNYIDQNPIRWQEDECYVP